MKMLCVGVSRGSCALLPTEAWVIATRSLKLPLRVECETVDAWVAATGPLRALRMGSSVRWWCCRRVSDNVVCLMMSDVSQVTSRSSSHACGDVGRCAHGMRSFTGGEPRFNHAHGDGRMLCPTISVFRR
jgi:hypothetical protein